MFEISSVIEYVLSNAPWFILVRYEFDKFNEASEFL